MKDEKLDKAIKPPVDPRFLRAGEMTMRDKFAESAIAGVALHNIDKLNLVAERAYALADAMMFARSKP